jgi:ribosomal protein S6--L-glutamate ligase
MIVSYHPLFEADRNILCAGRQPDAQDLAAIQAAKAIILGQGCYQSLYEMARANCPNVFPNYDAKFKYPGKIGQIKLFRELNTKHPSTEIYSNIASFQKRYGQRPESFPPEYPIVFKLDWGGGGDTVYLVNSAEQLQKTLELAAGFEKSGQAGFLLQEYIASDNKTLRVVVIGAHISSYWRIQQNSRAFHTNLDKGAVIDSEAAPGLQQKAVAVVKELCQKSGINLAGIDVIFPAQIDDPDPMLLEINYFFGRRGLGGSEAYYKILHREIQAWLAGIVEISYETQKNHKTVCL